MKKHIIITKLFETGGSNSHLKLLLNYLGEENVVLLLEDIDEVKYLQNISPNSIKFKIISKLHPFAHLQYRFSTNVKELAYIIKSLLTIWFISLKNDFATVTISSVEPERFIYLFWLPFIKVNYILHTQPLQAFTTFTTTTCNTRLGDKKKLLSVSEYMRLILIKNWAISNNKQRFVITIHNSLLENNRVKSNTSDELPDTITILTIGRVDKNKNPAVWLATAKEIIANNKNVKFIWLGGGPDFDHYSNTVSNEKNIVFLGSVNNPQSFLENADIYFQPSLQETHGIAVLEAMFNRLPCVAANVGGLPESVMQNYNGLLINPTNKDDCVKAISALIDNAKMRSEYGLNSYTRYKSMFSYQIFKSKMDVLYN